MLKMIIIPIKVRSNKPISIISYNLKKDIMTKVEMIIENEKAEISYSGIQKRYRKKK